MVSESPSDGGFLGDYKVKFLHCNSPHASENPAFRSSLGSGDDEALLQWGMTHFDPEDSVPCT